MRIRGEWPNPIGLRRGWSRADARPWNRTRADAHLRLVRGSSGFLADATRTVLEFGVDSVVSPPLMAGTQRLWRSAGFAPYVRLAILRANVNGELPGAGRARPLGDSAWAQVVRIDASAFGDEWRVELPALVEALGSTSNSVLLGVDDPDSAELAGYAIVATALGAGYLQRLAVAVESQGKGVGRTLTRAAHNWARRHGARTMVLNTKPDNERALSLYRSEGYAALPDRLELLRYEAA